MTMLDPKKISEGINYLRLLPNFNYRVEELAEELNLSVDHVKACIREAKSNKELTRAGRYKPPVKVITDPDVISLPDRDSGRAQKVKEVQIDFIKPLVANYSPHRVSEYTVLVPIKVTVIRE